MVLHPDEAVKRAIKFFTTHKTSPDKMGIYADPQSNRTFVNVFLASHIQSKKPFKFNKEYMPNWIPRFAHKPIVLFKWQNPDTGVSTFEHPIIMGASKAVNEVIQEKKAVGEVLYPFPEPDEAGTYRGVGEVIPKVGAFLKELNTEEVPVFSSPQVAYAGPDYDIKDCDPMHVCLTDDPAFPKEISVIKGVCEGDATSCMTQLQNASAHNFEAGSNSYLCFVDALKEVIVNSGKLQKDNTYLKIQNANSNSDMPDSTTSGDNVSIDTDISGSKDGNSPAMDTIIKRIETQANDALGRMFKEWEKTTGQKATADKTEKASETEKPEDKGKPAADKPAAEESEEVKALKQKVQNFELDNRRKAIAEKIPLQMVLDPKTNTVKDSLLKEFVDYWMDTNKTPEQIGELYGKQMAQLATVTNAPKTAKASAGNGDFTEEDIANAMTQNDGPQFDFPDVDGDSAADKQKIANATAGDNAWFLGFADVMVTPIRTPQKEHIGSPRRTLD